MSALSYATEPTQNRRWFLLWGNTDGAVMAPLVADIDTSALRDQLERAYA